MQDPVTISEQDANGLDALADQINSLSRHLGALRAEYMIAEARLIADLHQSYEIRDALLTQIARRYVEGKTGRWTYNAEQRALIQDSEE